MVARFHSFLLNCHHRQQGTPSQQGDMIMMKRHPWTHVYKLKGSVRCTCMHLPAALHVRCHPPLHKYTGKSLSPATLHSTSLKSASQVCGLNYHRQEFASHTLSHGSASQPRGSKGQPLYQAASSSPRVHSKAVIPCNSSLHLFQVCGLSVHSREVANASPCVLRSSRL
jgi:hypothetical protein